MNRLRGVKEARKLILHIITMHFANNIFEVFLFFYQMLEGFQAFLFLLFLFV